MTNTSWRSVALVLSGILIGCGAGAVHHASAQPFPANVAAPKWVLFCVPSEPKYLNRTLRLRGA